MKRPSILFLILYAVMLISDRAKRIGKWDVAGLIVLVLTIAINIIAFGIASHK